MGKGLFLFYVLIAFLVRLPFFFRDYIDRDESTFILMGQSIVDGYLPYMELWDVKPTLVFYFFAGLISLFGKSFVAIRMAGVFLVAITAFFSDRILRGMGLGKLAPIIGISVVYSISLFGSLQGLMSEHLTMALVMPALYGVLFQRKIASYFLCGLLFGLALMVKLNLAYAILFLGAVLCLQFFLIKKEGLTFAMVFSIGIGIVIPILISLLPYYLIGEEALWWNSVIEAPLAYSDQHRNSLLKMSLFLIPPTLFLFWLILKKKLRWNDFRHQILLLFLVGIVVSFLKAGRINGHYLIQFFPVFLVLIGIAIGPVSVLKPKVKKLVLILMLLLPVESYMEYIAVIKHKITKGTFYNGEGFSVPEYLTHNDLQDGSAFFVEYHIGYWVMDKKPPTKAATQPSNILKDEMFFAFNNPRKSGLQELEFIMDSIKPDIVVTRINRTPFDKDQPEANEYFETYVKDRYEVLDTVENAAIFKRVKTH